MVKWPIFLLLNLWKVARKLMNTKFLFYCKYLAITFWLLILATHCCITVFSTIFSTRWHSKICIYNKYFNVYLNTLHSMRQQTMRVIKLFRWGSTILALLGNITLNGMQLCMTESSEESKLNQPYFNILFKNMCLEEELFLIG